MSFVTVASLRDLKQGQSMQVSVSGQDIAIYNVDGTIYATSNICPHKGGPLAEGMLDDEIITCPLHGWRFDVTTGVCPNLPNVKVKTYKVKVENDNIMIEI